MKKILICIMILASLQACQVFQSLSSTTYIAPNQSFVLGQGKHGSYSATIKNVGNDLIEVIQVDEQGVKNSLGTLQIGEKKSYQVNPNHTIIFKNRSTQKQGIVEIFGRGDTSLSMGYQENK